MDRVAAEVELGEAAGSGAFLAFDGIGRTDRDADALTAARIARLFADGCGDRILISHGYTRRSHLTGYGGRPGLPYVIEQFAVMLLEEGLGAPDVRRILVDNAARAIATRTPDVAAHMT
jgi:phosphotriesterase-related protein